MAVSERCFVIFSGCHVAADRVQEVGLAIVFYTSVLRKYNIPMFKARPNSGRERLICNFSTLTCIHWLLRYYAVLSIEDSSPAVGMY